jgi:hypothetical protein
MAMGKVPFFILDHVYAIFGPADPKAQQERRRIYFRIAFILTKL